MEINKVRPKLKLKDFTEAFTIVFREKDRRIRQLEKELIEVYKQLNALKRKR